MIILLIASTKILILKVLVFSSLESHRYLKMVLYSLPRRINHRRAHKSLSEFFVGPYLLYSYVEIIALTIVVMGIAFFALVAR